MSSANAVGEILVASFGPQEWIAQVMDAVLNAVQLGIVQLGQGQQVQSNASPSDSYRFRARTREELLRDAPQAADSRAVDSRGTIADPAAGRLGSPPLSIQSQPKESTDEGAARRLDDGPVQWML